MQSWTSSNAEPEAVYILLTADEVGRYNFQKGGVSAYPDKLRAVANFPRRNNITQLHSFIGLGEQLYVFKANEWYGKPIITTATPIKFIGVEGGSPRRNSTIKKTLVNAFVLV